MLKKINPIFILFFILIMVGCSGSEKKIREYSHHIIMINLPGLNSLYIDRKYPALYKFIKESTEFDINTTYPVNIPEFYYSLYSGLNPGKHGIYGYNKRNPIDYSISPYITLQKYYFTFNKNVPLIDIRENKKFDMIWNILDKNELKPIILFAPISIKRVEKSAGFYISTIEKPLFYKYFQYYSDSEYLFKRSKISIKAKVTKEETTKLYLNLLDGYSHSNILLHSGNVFYIEINKEMVPLIDNEWTDLIPITVSKNKNIEYLLVSFFFKKRSKYIEIYISPLYYNPFIGFATSNDRKKLNFLKEKFGYFKTSPGISQSISTAFNIPSDVYFKFIMKSLKKKIEIFLYMIKKENYHLIWIDFYDLLIERRLNISQKKELLSLLNYMIKNVNHYKMNNTIVMLYSPLESSIHNVQVNLNRFLISKGFEVLKAKKNKNDNSLIFENINWNKTRCYAVDGNIYINLYGREKDGIVSPGREKKRLENVLRWTFKHWYDSVNETFVVERIYSGDEIFSGIFTGQKPDLIVGLNPKYSISEKMIEVNQKNIFSSIYATGSGGYISNDISNSKGKLYIDIKISNNKDVKVEDISATISKILGLSWKITDGKPIY